MKVIIAEKPSVAREIARVVRATNRKEGYIEGSNYTVTWALGHLITAAMPEAYGFKGFHKENLPILPPVFTLIPRQVKSGKGYKADQFAHGQSHSGRTCPSQKRSRVRQSLLCRPSTQRSRLARGHQCHPSRFHSGRLWHLLVRQGTDSDALHGLLPLLGK